MLVNVAAVSNGGTCIGASSTYKNYKCDNAIDGGTTPMEHVWVTQNEGAGAWIKIGLDSEYTLRQARILQRYRADEQFKDIQMTFSDGTQQEVCIRQF